MGHIYLIGDKNRNTALLSRDGEWDFDFTASDNDYCLYNADWERVPSQMTVATNVEAVKLMFGVLGHKHVHLLEDPTDNDVRWGSYTKWVTEGKRVYNMGTLARVKVKSEIDESYIPTALKKVKHKPNKDDVVVFYNVDHESHYAFDSDAVQELLSSCGRIVIRSTLGSLTREGSFLSTFVQDATLTCKTDLLLSSEGIRRASFNLRKALSWEQLVDETIDIFSSHELLKGFERIVVAYHGEGCLVYDPNRATQHLVYMPDMLEGQQARQLGRVAFGSMAMLTACLADAGTKPKAKKVAKSMRKGLAAVDFCLRYGFIVDRGDITIEFDETGLQRVFKSTSSSYDAPLPQRVLIPSTGRDGLSLVDVISRQKGQPIEQIARDYVRNGAIALRKLGVPLLEVGGLRTCSRTEIEELSNLRILMARHMSGSMAKPLSLCVFGAPGSGKSFSVEQIASSVGITKSPLTFNVSQMSGQADLVAAFHKITSEGLRGNPPLVFFDEFDSDLNGRRLGWLKYFLAPMQDGVYLDGGSEYSLGGAILVFGGGVFGGHAAFTAEAASQDGISAKVPDFVSRVQGYLDVPGVNPVPGDDSTPYLRRAILLRSLILRKIGQKDVGQQLMVDDKVLDAFLRGKRFLHDARSMGVVVNMSSVAPGRRFVPSSIENSCLAIHVSPDFESMLSANT